MTTNFVVLNNEVWVVRDGKLRLNGRVVPVDNYRYGYHDYGPGWVSVFPGQTALDGDHYRARESAIRRLVWG